ncbi:MAG: SusD/RagB family nutrient-binding outer membrane lipoprotein, partial [Alistipes sp.]|nr:SusD/RagB family nutrient-binding outer membrane lipoprotein [Alistipes sp.]
GGDAKTFYEQGVRLSFEQWGVGGVDDLRPVTSLTETYKDPNGDANSYPAQLSQIAVAWNDGAAKEEMQERIIIQKWIANFNLGNEAWADFRRTGYPHLIPAMESVVGNNSQGIRNLTLGARRMPYPADEVTNNPENYAKAVELLGGSDNMATRMWWDCNPAIK